MRRINTNFACFCRSIASHTFIQHSSYFAVLSNHECLTQALFFSFIITWCCWFISFRIERVSFRSLKLRWSCSVPIYSFHFIILIVPHFLALSCIRYDMWERLPKNRSFFLSCNLSSWKVQGNIFCSVFCIRSLSLLLCYRLFARSFEELFSKMNFVKYIPKMV